MKWNKVKKEVFCLFVRLDWGLSANSLYNCFFLKCVFNYPCGNFYAYIKAYNTYYGRVLTACLKYFNSYFFLPSFHSYSTFSSFFIEYTKSLGTWQLCLDLVRCDNKVLIMLKGSQHGDPYLLSDLRWCSFYPACFVVTGSTGQILGFKWSHVQYHYYLFCKKEVFFLQFTIVPFEKILSEHLFEILPRFLSINENT